MTSSNNTTTSASCKLNSSLVDFGCLGPALAIILALSFLKKRVKLKPNVCGGAPALVIPVDFLQDSHTNRFSFAVAFGAIAGTCFTMFTRTTEISGFDTPWKKALYLIVMVLVYGIISYPFFVCLMVEYKMVGAVLGLLYTAMRFVILVVLFCCNYYVDTSVSKKLHLNSAYGYSRLFLELPVLLCHLFLILRFAVLLYKEIRLRYWPRIGEYRIAKTTPSSCIAEQHDILHVRLLLGNQLNLRSAYTRSWFTNLRNKIYQTRPDFKFSTQIISTLVVAGIFVYQITLSGVLYGAMLSDVFKTVGSHYQVYFNILSDSMIVSFVFSGIFAILQILHFLKCHREHVLNSYRTTLGFSPSRLVSRSLSYSGYQIAYFAWGTIVMCIIFIIVACSLGLIKEFFPRLPPQLKKQLESILLGLVPVFIVPIAVWIFQYLLGKFVFRDRQFPDVTVTIDNQRLYCVFSFFFFFLNIWVGLFSSMLRLLKSMAIGTVFLSRLDRTPLMMGYHTWDKGYMSYIGFLNVLKSYSHPVMLVFCKLLLDRHYNEEEDAADGVIQQRSSYATAKQPKNRWFLAITLMRNPGLAKYRKNKSSMIWKATNPNTIKTAALVV